jgi:hypothetical protein
VSLPLRHGISSRHHRIFKPAVFIQFRAAGHTPKELEAIRESARQAYSRLILDTGEWGRRKKLLKKGECQTPELQMAVKLLFSLEFDPIRNLSKFPIPKVITEALARNDHSFFIRLGKTLAAKPLGLKQMRRIEPPALAVFLVRHWAEKRDNLPELYCLTQSSSGPKRWRKGSMERADDPAKQAPISVMDVALDRQIHTPS